jgi:flavodoxin
MKAAVISYSLTGNNAKLAEGLAESLSADRFSISEPGKRTMGTIAMDKVLGRTPKIMMQETKVEEHDLVVFVGPVWMGGVASPFRACFKQLGPKIRKYAYVSISGGADGPNPKLAEELTRRLGKKPAALVDLHIADLLPPDPKPTRNDTMGYKISDEQARMLAEKALSALKQVIG